MTGKNVLCVSLILLLIASMTPVSVSGSELPIISLVPMETNVPAPGVSFNVSVTIWNVSLMWIFGIKLGYNNTLLEAVRVYPGDICVAQGTEKWLPVDVYGVFHPDADPTINNTRTYKTDYSYVWVSVFLQKPNWFTGSGEVFKIEFTAKGVGNCTLDLYDTEVWDNWADLIDHGSLDGFVSVIPEFPAAIVTPLLLIATLAAAFLGKMFWPRKRKDALTAE